MKAFLFVCFVFVTFLLEPDESVLNMRAVNLRDCG